MNRVTADDPQYWDSESALCVNYQQIFKVNINTLKNRFNQTGGVHTLQWMYGCQWDDETGEVNGYNQYGYDGKDFIAFDLKTLTWIAPVPQAVLTKRKFDSDRAQSANLQNYFTMQCIEWLKKYLDYGKRTLQRTELPLVSLLQKSSSSPVTCHATGFYPRTASMFWRRDGGELHEDVKQGEILPNHDGTFQNRVQLDVSSVRPEDWRRYECVFQMSGVRDIVTTLDPGRIRSNPVLPSHMISAVLAVSLVVNIIIIAALGLKLYKLKREKYLRLYNDDSFELSQKLNPDVICRDDRTRTRLVDQQFTEEKELWSHEQIDNQSSHKPLVNKVGVTKRERQTKFF